MSTKTLVQHIAQTLTARKNCEKSGNQEWFEKHSETLEKLCEMLPSGSGIDCGTTLNTLKSSDNCLVFDTEFHHMDDMGSYDGWTSHTVRVTPPFDDIRIMISGQDHNGIKEYLSDVFYQNLTQEVTL